jgi:hypothetical protein
LPAVTPDSETVGLRLSSPPLTVTAVLVGSVLVAARKSRPLVTFVAPV